MSNIKRALEENKHLGFTEIYDAGEVVLHKQYDDLYVEISGLDNNDDVAIGLITVGIVGNTDRIIGRVNIRRHHNLRAKLKQINTDISRIIGLDDKNRRNELVAGILELEIKG